MEVYCTHPGCEDSKNSIPDDYRNVKNATEICRCNNCGMPLILQDHFVAISLLGKGGFSRTFTAKDLDFPYTTRVIKQLHPTNNSGGRFRTIEELFKREAIILDKLTHPRIPKFVAYFSMEFEEEIGYKERFFYLVQDYIEGQDLAKELEQSKNKKLSEYEVINILKEILNILKYIHDDENEKTNRVIYTHRDIKPHNIIRCSKNGKLYLIDFGIAKQISHGELEVETTSFPLSPGFASPEQHRGKTVYPASDLYSLAATCLCLLTGDMNPNEIVKNSTWKSKITLENRRFEEVLDEMLNEEWEHRPQFATDVLDLLSPTLAPNPNPNPDPNPNPGQASRFRRFIDWVKNLPRYWRSIIIFVFAFLLGIAITSIHHFMTITNQENSRYLSHFSRGEESLFAQQKKTSITKNCRESYNFKKQGMEAFKRASLSGKEQDFREAENLFTQSINISKPNPNLTISSQNFCIPDPETYIYQYNSQVAQSASAHNGKLPTIAVVIPYRDDEPDIGPEILRGVAQVLQEQNQNSPLFQILLVKNENDETTTKRIAEFISRNKIPGESNYFQKNSFNKSKILGVIGRYTSKYVFEVGEIYGKEKLVLIAPTSTAIRQLSSTTTLHPFVFRTAYNDSIAASTLSEYVWNQRRLKNVPIISDFQDNFSKSLARAFQSNLNSKNREGLYYICDVSASTVAHESCTKIPKQSEVEALMLAAPNVNFNQYLSIPGTVAKINFPIFAGDNLYKKQGLSTDKITIAVSFHADNAKDQFKSQTEKLWGIKKVSWRTMTSYDAAQAFVEVFRGSTTLTRQDIYDKLSHSNFYAPGATTDVKFDQDHDRLADTGVGVLVQLNTRDPNKDEYGFTLLKTPNSTNP